MMTRSKIFILVTICVAAIIVHYFFIDTLRLSELTESSKSGFEQLLVAMIDFDTGLTRFDLIGLRPKSVEWQRRIKSNAAIRDERSRNAADMELAAEMLNDPAIRKLMGKAFGVGIESVKALLPVLAGP